MLRDDVVWNIDAEIRQSLLGLSLIACREVGVGVRRWMEVELWRGCSLRRALLKSLVVLRRSGWILEEGSIVWGFLEGFVGYGLLRFLPREIT